MEEQKSHFLVYIGGIYTNIYRNKAPYILLRQKIQQHFNCPSSKATYLLRSGTLPYPIIEEEDYIYTWTFASSSSYTVVVVVLASPYPSNLLVFLFFFLFLPSQ